MSNPRYWFGTSYSNLIVPIAFGFNAKFYLTQISVVGLLEVSVMVYTGNIHITEFKHLCLGTV